MTHPHLVRTLAELDRILAGAKASQFNVKPSAGKWSACEILEHLDKTYSSTARLFEKVLENGELRVRPLNIKQRVTQLVVVNLGHMPRGLEAPGLTVPTGAPADEVVVRVRADFIRMAERHAQLAERYGRRRIAQHLVLGALNADGWAKFHWVHSRHHFGQIDRLLTL